MAKYDVFTYRNQQSAYVLTVQANLLEDLETQVVIPLVQRDKFKSILFKRLNPILKINNELFVMVTTDIASVRVQDLEHHICNLANEHEYDISNALDFLFQGF